MRSDGSDGISIYGQQPDEVSLSEEGRSSKTLQVVEGIYVDQGNRHSNQGQWGKKSRGYVYSTLERLYYPKVEKKQ